MRMLLIISFFFLTLPHASSQADGTKGLTVKGIITEEGRTLKDARIRVYNGKNRIVEQQKTHSDGSFRVRLALDGHYVLEFSKPGMVTKRLLFRTRTPEPNKVYHPFKVEVVLFDKKALQKHPKIDLDLPMGIVEYFPEQGDFNYVEDYTTKRLKEQEGLISETP